MRISDWSSVVCSSDLPAKPMKGMGRIQHLFTICSFWANANPSGKPHGSCEQCVRTLKVAVIYVVEEADSLFRRGGRDIGEIDRHADRKRHHPLWLLRRGLNRPAEDRKSTRLNYSH